MSLYKSYILLANGFSKHSVPTVSWWLEDDSLEIFDTIHRGLVKKEL
jgi:hypothetical protein